MGVFCYHIYMIGIDEVGRGAWAGPLLVVAARIRDALPSNLNDSKQLSLKKRELLFPQIKSCCDIGEGWVEPHEIDEFGLTQAMRLAVNRALIAIGADFDEDIIMDGPINYCSFEYNSVQTIIKADSIYPIVSAASIYAKVARDRHMNRIAKFYPFYGFEKHVGYGTQLHISSLKIHGVSLLHRKSYKPIKAYL